MPESPPGDDAALVGCLLRGDDAAFDVFFQTQYPRLFRFALCRTGQDADAAEEIAQATMIKAVRKLHTWRGEAALFTWLCAIGRHEIASWRERSGRHATTPLVEDDPELRDRLAEIAARVVERPDHAFERRETARLVQVALDTLPAHYADVLEWKYLQGFAVAEIAERLETGPKAVESLLTRARASFREAFAILAEEGSNG